MNKKATFILSLLLTIGSLPISAPRCLATPDCFVMGGFYKNTTETLFEVIDKRPSKGKAKVEADEEYAPLHLSLEGCADLIDSGGVLKLGGSAGADSPGVPEPERPPYGQNDDAVVSAQISDRLTFKSTSNQDTPVKITMTFGCSAEAKRGGPIDRDGNQVFGVAGVSLAIIADGVARYDKGVEAGQEDPTIFQIVEVALYGTLAPNGFEFHYEARFFCSAGSQRYHGGSGSATGEIYLKYISVEQINGEILQEGSDFTLTSESGLDYHAYLNHAPPDFGDDRLFEGLSGGLIPFLIKMDVYAKKHGQRSSQGLASAPGVEFDFTANLLIGAEKFKAKGVCDADGIAHFGDAMEKTFTRKDGSQFKLSGVMSETDESAFFTMTVTEVAEPHTTQTVVAEVAAYSAKKKAPLSQQAPSDLVGVYTVALPALDPGTQGQPVESYPSGAGVGSLTIGKGGVAKFIGRLADGTPLSCTGLVTRSNEICLYSPLYDGRGAFAARLKIRDTAGVSDLDATEALWVRPAIPGTGYPDGWPVGIGTGFVACKYVRPVVEPPASILPGLTTEDGDGNAQLTLSRGGLDGDAHDADPATPVTRALNVSPTNGVTTIGANAGDLELKLQPPTGFLRGTFRRPDGGKAKVRGVVLQKQGRILGYFPGPVETGALELAPVQ